MGCKLLFIWGKALEEEMPGTIKATKNNAVKIANKSLSSRNPGSHRQKGNHTHSQTLLHKLHHLLTRNTGGNRERSPHLVQTQERKAPANSGEKQVATYILPLFSPTEPKMTRQQTVTLKAKGEDLLQLREGGIK